MTIEYIIKKSNIFLMIFFLHSLIVLVIGVSIYYH